MDYLLVAPWNKGMLLDATNELMLCFGLARMSLEKTKLIDFHILL
jgi:hypothetical protein